MKTCPQCGQPLTTHHGVHLSPVQSEIFDRIERAGSDGLPREALQAALYSAVSDEVAFGRLKAHIWKINDKLALTDYRIVCGRYAPLRVIKLGYDGQDDFAKSLDVGYRHIRQRVAKGGPRGFMGKP